MSVKKGWVICPTCKRRIFRWTEDAIETAPGAKVGHPMDRVSEDEWATREDEVAVAWCPRGHRASPPQEPPFD